MIDTNFLNEAKRASGLSLAELADAAGLGYNQLHRYTKGLQPSEKSAAAIRKALVKALRVNAARAVKVLKALEAGSLNLSK